MFCEYYSSLHQGEEQFDMIKFSIILFIIFYRISYYRNKIVLITRIVDVKSRRCVLRWHVFLHNATLTRRKRSPSNLPGERIARAEVLSYVYIGKGLMPRVQQSLTSLARRVIPGLSSISRANAGIIFTRTPSDEWLMACVIFHFA